jgi:hypothetical protein
MPASPPTVPCEKAIAYLKAVATDERDDGAVLDPDRDASPVLRELGDGLLVSYVVDQGSHFEFVNHGHLAAQGFTVERLHEVGLANLADAVSAHGVQVHPDEAIFAVMAGGNFEASLILFDDLWENGFRQFVSGTYAVAIPTRDILAFGDAADPAARSQLRDVVARTWPTADHLLSDRLFIREGGVWKALAD